MENNELFVAASNLSNLVAMFVNQCSVDNVYTSVEKSSLYVVLDAIKAQTTIVTNQLDSI